MRILFVKPKPKAGVLLCWKLGGCYFQCLEVDLRLNVGMIGPCYGNPLIFPGDLDDEVHDSLARELRCL